MENRNFVQLKMFFMYQICNIILFSVSKLDANGMKIVFENGKSKILKNKCIVDTGRRIGKMYVMDFLPKFNKENAMISNYIPNDFVNGIKTDKNGYAKNRYRLLESKQRKMILGHDTIQNVVNDDQQENDEPKLKRKHEVELRNSINRNNKEETEINRKSSVRKPPVRYD